MPGEKILIVDDCETVRQVISDILTEAGFNPIPASDGAEGIELAQSYIPDLILLDFIMPKINGLRFCQMLRKIENLKNIPVILMSVKATSIGDKFTKIVDVADIISKPFSPDILLAVINHKLGKPKKEKLTKDIPSPIKKESIESPVEESQKAFKDIKQIISNALLSRIPEETSKITKNELLKFCDETITMDLLMELSYLIARINPISGIASLAGMTSAISIGDIIQLLAQSSQTGMLKIIEENKYAQVYFKDGKISFARFWGESEEFLLGRYLLKEELITLETLERIIKSPSPKTLLGERLVRSGLITREDLKKVLEEQTAEVIYEILRWQKASYSFHPEIQSDEAIASDLRLDTSEILMEGLRRIDEWRLIEKEINDFNIRLEKTPLAFDPSLGLSPQESLVLDLIDGTRSIKDIIKETLMASFDVSKIVYELLSMKIVKKIKE